MSTATRALFCCDGAEVPREFKRASWSHKHALISTGPHPNMSLGGFNETPSVTSALTGRAHDLVRVAAYAYIADQAISRGTDSDVHLELWRRTMSLCLPVSDPDFWGQHHVVTALEDALGFATDDRWRFAFSLRPERAPDQMPLFDERGARVAPARPPDHVLLLSGGADSLCAAVQPLSRGRRPHLVSHCSSSAHDARQQDIGKVIGYRFDAGLLTRTRFPIHCVRWKPKESSQRTRAFLFASLGASVAHEAGAEQVVLADNGVVSLGLPLHQGLPGALMSRTTHPGFLERFNELLGLVLPSVRVVNPLQTFTRAESLSILNVAGCPDLLQTTNSCSRVRNTGGTAGHCGYCSQCVDRRFGVIRAGLESHELPNPYVLDVFTRRLDDGEKRTIPVSYVTRAKKIESLVTRSTRTDGLSSDGLFREFPDLHRCLPSEPRALNSAKVELVSLLRRHAVDVRAVMKSMAMRHWDALYGDPSDAPGDVAQDSLLRLVFGARPIADQHVMSSVTGAAAADDAPPPVQSTEGRVFRRQGDVWFVSYEGETKLIDDLDGMSYIAYLLSKPGEDIRAVDLYRLLGTGRSTGTNGIHIREATDAGLRVSESSATSPQIDRPTRRQVGERLIEIGRERARALRERDETTLRQLDDEVATYDQYVGKATGLHGADRATGAEEEHARDAVRSAVSRAKKRIARHLPRLADHLK